MFVINIQKEMVRGIHQVEQKVNYFYASGSMNERLLKSLTEQLCLQNSEQGPLMSPTLSIPRHLFALVAQNHGNELTLYTGHRSVQMALHYELLLDDHYIAETKCQFDCASDDAVMSVITCLDISSSGTVAEIILKKKNNQVSFVRYTFHELNAKEFKTLNLKLSYAPCSGVNIGICLEKYLVLPRTKHTSKINLALMFDLIKPNELEPKVIYIFLKDCIHLQDTNTSSDDCSSNNPNTDHGQSNSAQTKSQNEIHQHCTPSQPNVLDIQETCKENIPQTDQPLQEPVSSQESKKDHETKIKPVTVELNPHDPLISMLMPSTDKTSTVAPEKTGFKFDSAALATAVRDTVCRFFKDSCSVDFFNFCTSASPSLSKEATDSGLNVNVIQINNIITCNMDHVTNAVVGGQLYNTVIHKNTEADME
ncbi:hypothetical protein Bpfe_008932 [Biomphalaria pfeifferi]|uniref:Uncharacterized protein n=1 Tax=Biomphalaria pfeifferi TaxID=112525 RepID=A0AAD8FEK4_BIOPF|nr:hypothetical protein Bpfe_008932 [Biomphalaria pfeifferi]